MIYIALVHLFVLTEADGFLFEVYLFSGSQVQLYFDSPGNILVNAISAWVVASVSLMNIDRIT